MGHFQSCRRPPPYLARLQPTWTDCATVRTTPVMCLERFVLQRRDSRQGVCGRYVIAKFHYTGPTGPDQTKSEDFVGDPGLRPGSREKVRAGPRGSPTKSADFVWSGPVGPV